MGDHQIPALTSFSAGALIKSAEVNNNFSSVRDKYNALELLAAVSEHRTTTSATVANTTTETQFFSYTLPGGTLTLGGNRLLKILLMADLLNDPSSNTPDFVLKLGGSTFASWLNVVIPTPTPFIRIPVLIEALIQAAGASAQRCMSRLYIGDDSHIVGGGGDAAGKVFLSSHQSLAVDSSANQAVAATVQHSTADPTVDLVFRAAQLYLI